VSSLCRGELRAQYYEEQVPLVEHTCELVTRRAMPFVMSSIEIGPAIGPVQNKNNDELLI
jgi:hypothetical protein